MLARRCVAAFRPQQQQPTAGISSKIFIKGLPSYVTESQLNKTLNVFGPIKKIIVIVPHMMPRENVKFVKALVHFHKLDSALAAEDELHGTMLQLSEDVNHRYRVDVDFSFKEINFPNYSAGSGDRRLNNNKSKAATQQPQKKQSTQQEETATSPSTCPGS